MPTRRPSGCSPRKPGRRWARTPTRRSRRSWPTCPRKSWPTSPTRCPRKHAARSPTTPSRRSQKKCSRKRMSKRKKTTQPNGEGVVTVPVEGDLTSPDLAPTVAPAGDQAIGQTNGETLGEHVFDSLEPDTQVGPAPTADSWDGPTNAGTEDELAELVAASVSSVEERTVLTDSAASTEGEAAPLESEPAQAESAGGPAEGDAGQAEGEPLPEVAPGRLASIVESLLFASDHPLTLAELKRLVGERDGGKLTAALEELRARREESGVQVMQAAGGWQLRTNPDNVAWVSRILAGKPPRLSRALLETLAIVAYRQPITRPEIDEI